MGAQGGQGGSADGQAVLGYILTSGPEKCATWRRRIAGMSGLPRLAVPQGALGYALSLARDASDAGAARRGGAVTCAAPPMPVCRRHCICWR